MDKKINPEEQSRDESNDREGSLAKKVLHTAISGLIGISSLAPAIGLGYIFYRNMERGTMDVPTTLLLAGSTAFLGAFSAATGLPYLFRAVRYTKDIIRSDYNVGPFMIPMDII